MTKLPIYLKYDKIVFKAIVRVQRIYIIFLPIWWATQYLYLF